MSKHPLLYEINARCWLRELSEQAGKSLTLADVPDSEFARWEELGFTHIWLMGVWPTGPRAREHALRNPFLRQRYDQLLPGWRPEDIGGSPYAIADYEVSSALGGGRALAAFRERLHRHGLKLVLDFVPNHLGVDHSWLKQHPERFVLADKPVAGTFSVKARGKTYQVAHGRDPYFDPWTDTAQLDFRRAETRAAMSAELQRVADQCDGVRGDMAMLVLKDVFAKTWAAFPVREPGGEFWREAISAVKMKQPEFHFLAEAYWGLEETLQRQGFEYCYDKEWYDHLVRFDGPALKRHAAEKSVTYHRRAARFLENHDERRISGCQTAEQHLAAAALLVSMPGLRLIHEGQLEGWREHLPVQLARRPRQPEDGGIAALYRKLLKLMPGTSIGRGQWKALRTTADTEGASIIANLWKGRGSRFEVVVVNWSKAVAMGTISLEMSLGKRNWRIVDLLDGGVEMEPRIELEHEGIRVEMTAYGVKILRCEVAEAKRGQP